MDSYIQYSHEALCLLLERKDCEIERLTAKLAECTEEAERLKQNIVDTLTERLSDVETARKQVAQEIIQYIEDQGIIEVGWNKQQVYEIDRSDIVELRQRYGLEE